MEHAVAEVDELRGLVSGVAKEPLELPEDVAVAIHSVLGARGSRPDCSRVAMFMVRLQRKLAECGRIQEFPTLEMVYRRDMDDDAKQRHLQAVERWLVVWNKHFMDKKMEYDAGMSIMKSLQYVIETKFIKTKHDKK